MELDDVFYIGRRPTTLRMVLGLMEDADNSLETYHWATPALLHAIYTNDRLLSQYVEEVFQRKGLTPYAPYKKDEDKTTEKTPEKMVMDKHVMWSKAKMACQGRRSVLSEEPLVGGVPAVCRPSGVQHPREPLQGIHRTDRLAGI